MKSQIILLFILCGFSMNLFGQNPDALLDLESNSQGLLFPRVMLADKSDPAPMTTHVQGMVVYNLKKGGVHPDYISKGFYYNTGSGWERLLDSGNNGNYFGDLKHGFQIEDHKGWYLLNGRDLDSLPDNAKLAALALGMVDSIPNATNRILTQRGAMYSEGGADSVVLSKDNIPPYALNGVTAMSGIHNHLIDSPPVTTNSAGQHTHDIRTGAHSASGAESQGWPSGNNHAAFRTTERNQMTAGSSSNRLNLNAGAHVHTVNIPNFLSQTSGGHTHSISMSSGGGGVAVSHIPAYLSTNVFIYLGK